MKKLSLLLICSGLLFTAPLKADPDHHHHHNGAHVLTALVLNDGAKWPVDEVLSSAMLRLRAELLSHLDDIHHHRFTRQQYQQFATVLEQNIKHIVANCKLTPEADAQFHLVLAAMIQSQTAMAGADLAIQRQGAVQLLRALQRYPEFFQDNGFLPITH